MQWYEWMVAGILLGIGALECVAEIWWKKRKVKREKALELTELFIRTPEKSNKQHRTLPNTNKPPWTEWEK